MGLKKLQAQAGRLLGAGGQGRQAAGGGQREASGNGDDRPGSVVKEANSDTRLGGGPGGDTREGRMKARKALFCGSGEGDEQHAGSAEESDATSGTTGLQREAQEETAQGTWQPWGGKVGAVTEQVRGKKETMQSAEVAAAHHEPSVGDTEGDEEAGWERWREIRGEKEKGQSYKDQLDRAAGRRPRGGRGDHKEEAAVKESRRPIA